MIAYAVLCLLCPFLISGYAFAEGRLLIKPHIETGWQRDSNFHKAEDTEREVDTYFVKPGLEFGYTTEKSLISLDYWFNVLRYDDKDDNVPDSQKADQFDYTEHMADFTAETWVTERLQLGIDNLYWKTRDDANANELSNVVDRFEYDLNRFSPRLLYNFGEKFGLGLKYTNLLTDYDNDSESEDSDENRGTFTFYYYFDSLTSLDLDYQYWKRDYDKTSQDYDSNQVMLNLNKQFNRFVFSVGAGYHMRDFDNASNAPAVEGGDIEQFVWKTSVFAQNPPDATSKPKSSMYLSIGNNLNDSGAGNSYYAATRFDARFTYLLFERLNLTLEGWFQNSDYETSAREDDRWYVAAAADYYLFDDMLSIGVQGGAEERDSSQTGRDFENEFVMVNVKFNYDMGSK